MLHSTLLQLQQEVVDMVDLPILIPAMNKEQLLTPEQNSHIDNGQYPPQKCCRDLTIYICGKGDDGLIAFYRCLRTTAVRHANHGHLADSMLQQWSWLSQHEPPLQPPPPILTTTGFCLPVSFPSASITVLSNSCSSCSDPQRI